MTSDDITDLISKLPDVPGNWALLVDHLRDAADELDCLNARVTSLEAFARELWEHDKFNMHVEADGDWPGGDYCDWARGMIAKARELGIEE